MRRKKRTASSPAQRPAKSRGKRWSDEIKAEAMAQLLRGIRPSEVSESTGVPDHTISDWGKKLGNFEAIRESRIGDLIFEHLAENLITLAAISRHARDPKWLEGIDARSLALLHGIMADQSFRILAASERARPADELPAA